ncbi:unnamed protein product [Peniophora sp. CBMAI 1063]|nr:unnamed protein product [Peniophora sp. CBMAI 1063]
MSSTYRSLSNSQYNVGWIYPISHECACECADGETTPEPDVRAAETPSTATPLNQTSAPIDPNEEERLRGGVEVDEDGDSTGSDSDYQSFSESEDEQDDQTTPQPSIHDDERLARELQRQMLMEAAGLVVKREEGRRPPPPRPVRRRAAAHVTTPKKHRPAPAVPESSRRQRRRAADDDKDLPEVPADEEPEPAPTIRLDDAFERYEAFKSQAAESNNNRFSVASFDSASFVNVSPPIAESASTSSNAAPSSPSSSIFRIPAHAHRESGGGLLSHFLGRSKTPIEEARSRPVISGPISGPVQQGTVEEAGGTTPTLERADSTNGGQPSGFGSSWSSLVDKAALEGLPERERKRQEAIFEFIATEAAYVRDLQLIVEVFYGSMLNILDQKAIAVIFANVEDILLTNTTFLSALEERQRDCRLYIDRIGDLLDHNMGNMKIYREYCVNQANAARVLQSLRKENAELAAHLQALQTENPAVRNLDLSSYLLVPMQRVTRYPLLIKQILHYTETDEDSKLTEHALRTSEKILGRINEEIRAQEGKDRLRELSQDLWIGNGRLDLTAPTRQFGERKLLKEGILAKAKSGRRLRAVLCNDIFILTDEQAKTLYRIPMHLSEIQVGDTSGRDETSFRVSKAYPRGGDAIVLRASSARECQAWLAEIEAAAQRCRDAERQQAAKKAKPVQSWQPAPSVPQIQAPW